MTQQPPPNTVALYERAIERLAQDTTLFSSERWLCLYILYRCLHAPKGTITLTARGLARASRLVASTVLIGIPKLRDGGHLDATWEQKSKRWTIRIPPLQP